MIKETRNWLDRYLAPVTQGARSETLRWVAEPIAAVVCRSQRLAWMTQTDAAVSGGRRRRRVAERIAN
jgi:hypothetical protein